MVYGTGNYAQSYTAEGYERERQRKQALADLFKALEAQQGLIRIKLEIWCRNGASEALRKDIAETAAEYGRLFEAIVGSSPIRLEEQTKTRNRY